MEEQKNAEFHIKESGAGKVEAVFSVFNMVDSDGDVIVKGAVKSGFPKSGYVPMVWSHDWKQPVGKGTIESDDNKAVFKGSFFMDTEAGQEAYKLVKNMGDLQQWSFGYEVNDSEQGEFTKDSEKQTVRYLKDLSVFEVSPVLVGANRETYTLAMKHAVQQESGEVKDEIKMDEIEEVLEDSLETEKGHTPVHTVQQSVGQIAEDLKDIMGKLPKDINEPLPSWWVDMVKMTASKINEVRDYIVDPAFMETDKPMETDGWMDDDKDYEDDKKDDNQIESEVKSFTFIEHVENLKNEVDMFKNRVMSLALLRAEKGKRLGKSASEGVASVANTLEDTFRDLDELLNEDVLPIPEAEVEVDITEEVTEVEEVETVEEVISETEETESVEETTTVEEDINLDEEISGIESEEAFNQLFLDTQAALARTLGVEIQDSVDEG